MKQLKKTEWSLQKKLTVVILSIITLVLLLSSTLFISANYFFANNTLNTEANTIAQLTANQLEAAIIFDHQDGAQEILNNVSKRPNIIQATVYLEDGKFFASAGDNKKTVAFEKTQQCQITPFYSKKLNSCSTIKDNNQTIAHLHLIISREELFNQQYTQIYIVILSIFASLIFSLIVIKYVSHNLIKPLKKLAKLTNKIAIEKDFSSREEVAGISEVKNLSHSFNKMLDEIELKDRELQSYTANLELLVSERTTSLEDALEQANQANTSKTDFFANMSHELRTPLHGILSFARFGLKNYKTAAPDKLLKYFDRINVSGERLLTLLNDLLDLSKLEAGKMQLNKQNASLLHTVENCVAEQSAWLKEKKLSLVWNKEHCNTEANFDHSRIGQVIANLLSNAIKFSPEGKTISIQFSEVDYHHQAAIQLTIKDQGVGIPQDELENIFDKFIQSTKTETNTGGTGLGLAICHEIIGLHQGKIWAESEQEEGSQLSFVLPVT